MSGARYATISELRAALEARGLRPKHRLGQNFLIDLNLLRCVADAGELTRDDVVLEVGCGPAALTRLLAERAGFVVAAEIDRDLFQLASESVGARENVQLVLGDALDSGALAPALCEAVTSAAERLRCRLKLVANLPYGVATAVITALLRKGPLPALIAVTVQSEVARRMAARPGTHEYGLLSVVVQASGVVEHLRTLGPTVFWPRPKVSSALVRVRVDKAPPDALARVAGRLLEQRRKQSAKAMQVVGMAGSGEEAASALAACGIAPDRRPDHLSVEDFLRLTAFLEGRKR